MEFKIYSGGTGVTGGGGTLLWTEDYLVGGTGGVSITDGVFQVNLGANTTLPGSVDFNNNTLWLSMQIGNTSSCTITTTFQSNCGGDGEMSPYVRFTAAPYAFNSDLLDGVDSTAFGQLSLNQTWTGTQTLQPTTNITSAIVKQTSAASPTADILNIQTANATSILQVTGPTANEAAVTLNSVGATRDLTLDSASGTLKLGSNTTTLQKSGTAFTFDVNNASNSTLTITNAGSGTASLAVEGNITTTATVNGNTIDRSTAGTLSIGTGTATSITIAKTGVATTVGADLTVQGGLTAIPATDNTNGFQVQTVTGTDIVNVNTTQNKNLLVDGNFESTVINNAWTALNGATLSSATTPVQFGSRSLQAVLNAANASDGVKYVYPFRANTTYALSVYAAITSGSTATYEMGTVQNGGAQTNCGVTGVTPTGSLTRYTCTFTTGTTTTPNDFFYFKRTTAAAGTLVFDGAQLEQSSSVTAYSDSGIGLVNLITINPSFENGNTNGWALHNPTGTGVSIAVSTDIAQYGTYSLKLVTGTTANNGVEYRYPFQPNTQYALTFSARIGPAGASASFSVGHNDNPASLGTPTGDTTCTTTPDITLTSAVTSSAWTQFTCSFTTGSTIGPSSNIFIRQTDTTSDNLYIDSVTLVQATSGLAFAPVSNSVDVNNYTNNIVLNGNGSGELQPWKLNNTPIGATTSTDTTNRVIGHEGAATMTANGYLYVIGGYDGTNVLNSVMYAKFNADGSLGNWFCQGTAAATSCGTSWTAASGQQNSANSLPAGRRLLAVTQANGYVYAIGGFDGAASDSTVYYAKLNGDGSTGVWLTNTYNIGQAVAGTAQPRVAPSVLVVNGYMYVLGGCSDAAAATCATPQNTVYYAKVYADGSVGPWNTNANTLTVAKGMGTATYANGYLYFVGGASNATTVTSNVYCASINGDGTVNSFATTTCNSLPAARAQHAMFVANGYMYVVAGCSAIASGSCSTATNNVWYAPFNGDGTLGAWVTAANQLPANRGAASFLMSNNSYMYVLGGYDGTTRQATVYYASTPRVLISGGLDLIGLSSQSGSDSGGAGTLTAGNTSIVGSLRVDGYADINNGLSVDSAININAISATAGQTVFNINNLNSNSIFNVRHMSTAFGSLATAGAFMQKDSYWGEEFNVGHTTACNTTAALSAGTVNAFARGDVGGNANTTTACASGATTTVNGGELNVTDVIGTATITQNQCLISSQNAANGIERISAAITAFNASSKTACAETLAANTTTSNKIFTTTNLPVIAMKLKVSAMTVNATGSVVTVGANIANNPGTDGAGVNLPNTGVFFTNCSTYTAGAPSGCSNTNWYGMVTSGNALVGTVQTCSVGSGNITTNFSYLRIEVRGTSDIHFFADYNTSDGINESECGTGVSAASNTAAMAPWLEVKAISGSANLTNTIDVDYYRSWQDDNVAPETLTPTNTDTTPNGTPLITAPPLVTDSTTTDTSNPVQSGAPPPFIDFSAATNNDTVFHNDVYVNGTLFVDKIKANQIEGLSLLTDQISSLSAKIAADQQAAAPTQNTSSQTSSATQPTITINQLGSVTIHDAVISFNLGVNGLITAGGLTLNGPAQFNDSALFNGLATFSGDSLFQGRTTFNNDSGGFATIHSGQQNVKVVFAKEYTQTPIVTANIKNGQFVQYAVDQLDTKGFTITLKDPATADIQFSWSATSIKDPQTTDVPLKVQSQ